jgi:hypothetical protein
MIRSILAAIAGYAAMVVGVIAGITISWAILGGEGAFRGEGPEPSTAWMILSVVFGLLAAVAGGWVALRIGRSTRAVKILVGLVIVLGLYSALTGESEYAGRKKIDKPVARMDFVEAGAHAKQPTWYLWTIPIVGVAGVLLGGRSRTEQP